MVVILIEVVRNIYNLYFYFLKYEEFCNIKITDNRDLKVILEKGVCDLVIFLK